jgi:hypothetical protein
MTTKRKFLKLGAAAALFAPFAGFATGSHLSAHVICADYLTVLVKRDLSLQVNDLARALNDRHRESAERGATRLLG